MNFKEIIEFAVIVGMSVCLMPDLWCLVLHAHRLAQALKEWEHTGPHTTFLGKARERLAAGGWVAAPRDPLVECAIPAGGGWRDVLHRVLHAAESLDCMERQVKLARLEHVVFCVAFVLGVAYLSLSVAWMVWRAFARLRLARRHHQPGAGLDAQDLLPEEGSSGASHEGRPVNKDNFANTHTGRAHSWPRRPAVPVVKERFCRSLKIESCVKNVEPLKTPPEPRRDGVQRAHTHTGRAHSWPRTPAVPVVKERRSRSLTKHESGVENVAPLKTPPEPRRDGVQQEAQQEEAVRIIRRSLHVPRRFRERLLGPRDCLLEYLQRHYSVLVFMEPAKNRLHVKGVEKNVLQCYAAVKTLLAEWTTLEAALSS